MQPGTRLGPYEILGPLGAGGMGEVYRARDTKLARDVAIKVLPAPVAGDPERLARLGREAQVLAALNHPNIATIYGLEDAGAVTFLAMELAAGRDLAQLLTARGPVPWPDARAISLQIGAALAAAHDRGIVHRDLKPANVVLADDGTVKVLDFGLAKAIASDTTCDDAGARLTASPTVLGKTASGVILGTAAYMSPEQARGKAVDRRTDIWAFGCVLYELLTGNRPFDGETLTDVLAAIVKEEPDLDRLPTDVPAQVRTLIERCLRKDPAERLRDAGDAALLLREATGTHAPEAMIRAARGASGLTRAMAAGAALGLVAVLSWLAWGSSTSVSLGADSELQLSIPLPDGTQVHTTDSHRQEVAVSPDGRLIVWTGIAEDGRRLYRRAIDDPGAHPIPGTEDAIGPFFSPDGQWLAFYADGAMQKVPIGGGLPVRITESIAHYGAFWDESQRIVYAPTPDTGLWQVDAEGGTASPVPGWNRDGQLIAGHSPVPISGDPDSFVFAGIGQDARSQLYRYSWSTGRAEPLLNRPLPLFVGTSRLFSLDDDGLLESVGYADGTITGSPQPVLAGVGQFAASNSGTVATVRDPALARLARRTRAGAMVGSASESHRFVEVALSPGGEQIALRVPSGAAAGIWLADLDRAGMTQVARSPAVMGGPVWSPDGASFLVFGADGMSRRYLDGSETEVVIRFGELFEQLNLLQPGSWSADGWLALESISAGMGPRIWAMNLNDREAAPRSLVPDPTSEFRPARSPDGRWLAYESTASGQLNIHVRPFLAPGVPVQVSANGANRPRWTRGGTELVFRSLDRLLAVSISVDATAQIHVGTPEALFGVQGMIDFDVSANGETFYVLESVYPRRDRIDLILNFGR